MSVLSNNHDKLKNCLSRLLAEQQQQQQQQQQQHNRSYLDKYISTVFNCRDK